MGEDGKSSVNVEIGAKASIEVKAEIPKESAGRAVDALVDIIRPFSEARGLKADNIRLQRAEIAYKIAAIARQTAAQENLVLKPPPTKFLVPFLEKASLEDQDEVLHSHWASLLLSASTHYDARHLTFIDLMTRLSSDELVLLEEVCLSEWLFPETNYPDGHIVENMNHAAEFCRMFRRHESGLSPNRLQELFDAEVKTRPFEYGRVMHANVHDVGRYVLLYTNYGVADSPKHRSLEIVEHEKLVAFHSFEEGGTAVKIGYFDLTFLGIAFVKDCSPKAREAIAEYQREGRTRLLPLGQG